MVTPWEGRWGHRGVGPFQCAEGASSHHLDPVWDQPLAPRRPLRCGSRGVKNVCPPAGYGFGAPRKMCRANVGGTEGCPA